MDNNSEERPTSWELIHRYPAFLSKHKAEERSECLVVRQPASYELESRDTSR